MREWNCSAYGPTPAHLGDLCFMELANGPCPDRSTCERLMTAERDRLWRRLTALQALGADLGDLLRETGAQGPEDLLRGD